MFSISCNSFKLTIAIAIVIANQCKLKGFFKKILQKTEPLGPNVGVPKRPKRPKLPRLWQLNTTVESCAKSPGY